MLTVFTLKCTMALYTASLSANFAGISAVGRRIPTVGVIPHGVTRIDDRKLRAVILKVFHLDLGISAVKIDRPACQRRMNIGWRGVQSVIGTGGGRAQY